MNCSAFVLLANFRYMMTGNKSAASETDCNVEPSADTSADPSTPNGSAARATSVSKGIIYIF